MGLIVEFLIVALERFNYASLTVVLASLATGVTIYIFASFAVKNDSANMVKNVILRKH